MERQHLADLLVNRRMMFSSPNAFNDPYDCRPVFKRGTNAAKDRARIGGAWDEGRKRAGMPKPSRGERERHITHVMLELSTQEGAAAQFKPFLDNQTGVFCMSKDWCLLTQWAYYADEGRGLCVEYEIERDAGFDRVFGVQYSDERPVVEISRLLCDDEYRTKALFAAVTTKAADWAHEREVRALQMKAGLATHPLGMLRSIMLGIAATDRNVQWLIELLKENEITVPVYRTELSLDTFTLERHQLPGRVVRSRVPSSKR